MGERATENCSQRAGVGIINELISFVKLDFRIAMDHFPCVGISIMGFLSLPLDVGYVRHTFCFLSPLVFRSRGVMPTSFDTL